MELKQRHVTLSDQDIEDAKRKAKKHLTTLPANQQDSLSAAIRHLIKQAKEPKP